MNYWNRFPLFRMIVPFVLGILLAHWWQQMYPAMIWITLILLILGIAFTFFKKIVTKYKNRWFYGVVFHLFLFLSGYQLTILHSGRFAPNHILNTLHNISPDAIVADVISPPKFKGKWAQADLEIVGYYVDGKLKSVGGKVKVRIERDENSENLWFGDRIIFSSSLNVVKPPRNPGGFSYKEYLALQSIYHEAYIKAQSWKLLESRGGRSIIAFSSSMRDKLLNIFRENGLSNDELAVASALILGDKGDLSAELKSDFSKSGAMHVLAVSGLHVGIIYLVLNWLLGFLARLRNGIVIKAFVIILLLWCYAILTGLSPSVMRATTMLSFLVIGRSMQQYTDVYNTLIVSAFLLLIIDPNLIHAVGFQLSYLAVFGIVYLYPKFYNAWEPRTWIVDKVWALTCVSLAAQLATFPLSLYYFHQFPNWFLISNLLVIPLATLIIYLGILVFISSPFQLLSVAFTKVMSVVVGMLNGSVSFVRSLPFSTVDNVSINPLETFAIYMVISFVVAFFVLRHVSLLKLGLVTAILLLMFQIYENQGQLEQRQIVFYSVPRHTAIEFIDGKSSILIADSALLDNNKSLDYYTNSYRILSGIENTDRFSVDELQHAIQVENWFNYKSFIQFFNSTMLVIDTENENYKTGATTHVSCLLLRGKGEVDVLNLLRRFTPEIVVLDGTVPVWKAGKLADEFVKYDVECINTWTDGAYISVL